MSNSADRPEKYVPLGTICRLKDGNHKVMITGFCMYDNDDNNTLYDYCGCAYPEGMLSTNEVTLFNHDEIEKFYIIGPSNEEDKKFKVNLTSMIQVIESTSNSVMNDELEGESSNEEVYTVE